MVLKKGIDMKRITFVCGCIEDNLEVDRCPVHGKPILQVLHTDKVLAHKVRAERAFNYSKNLNLLFKIKTLRSKGVIVW